MTELQLGHFVRDHLEDMLFVTGIQRSGTSILGKLIGTFEPVEYAYEPPLLSFLNAKVDLGEIPAEYAVEVALMYLYYDYFLEHLHGRQVNFRPEDKSYILGMKSFPRIVERWGAVDGWQDAIPRAADQKFAVKSPANYTLLEVLFENVDSFKVVDIGRDLDRIVASMMSKGWFSDEYLRSDRTGGIAFHRSEDDVCVSYYVDEDDEEFWQEMSTETRTVYTVNRYAEARLDFQDAYGESERYHDLRYERLISDPGGVADSLCTFMDTSFGPKSADVAAEISPTQPPSDIESILDNCHTSVRDRYQELRTQVA